MHGFALNCSNSFEAYEPIIACGIADAGVTSISRELGRTVTPEAIIPLVSEQLAWALDFVPTRTAATSLRDASEPAGVGPQFGLST
jgi:lipoyl(octanoyl) transferase